MFILDELKVKKNQIVQLALQHGAHNLRLFGSVIHHADQDNSDIDLIVDFDPERSLLDFVALKQDLEDLLHRSVDLVEADAINPTIKERILHEAVPL